MSATVPSSNATNFTSYVQSGVDPRTGQHSFSVTLARLRPRYLTGIERAVALRFSVMQTENLGYGQGWSVGTTELDVDQSIALGDGRSFQVDTSGPVGVGERFVFRDQKLQDFYVLKTGSGTFQVAYKDGVVEELEYLDGPSVTLKRILFPNGEVFEVKFGGSYNGRPLLQQITDSAGAVVLKLTYDSGAIRTITNAREDGGSVEWEGFSSNGKLTRLTVPQDSEDSAAPPDFVFTYETLFDQFLVMNHVAGPTGREESINYSRGTGHAYVASDHQTHHVPYVIWYGVDPGGGQPEIVKSYEYPNTSNFLGNPNSAGWAQNQDNLYLAADDYIYETVENTLEADGSTVATSAHRVYNSYHLLESETTTSGATETKTVYTYNTNGSDNFFDQPANLQLPKKIETNFKNGDGATRTETTLVTTDVFGNTLSQTEPSGIQRTYEFYGHAGVSGQCPPDPLGAFDRFLKKVVIHPAETGPATTLEYRPDKTLEYQYTQLAVPASVGELPTHLVLVSKETENGTAVTTYTYLDDVANPSRHGLLATKSLTCAGKSTTRTLTYTSPTADQLEVQCTQAGHDGSQCSESQTFGLISRHCFEQVDARGVKAQFAYDALGRPIEINEAVGTAHARTRSVVYEIPGTADAPCRVSETGPDGVVKRAIYDGNLRLLAVERQDDWGVLRTTEEYAYDHLGRLASETSNDYLFNTSGGVTQTLSSDTRYAYDDWGGVCRIEHDGGRVEVSEYDPVALTRTEGIEGLGSKHLTFNTFQMPTTCATLDRDENETSRTTFTYDGLGRVTSSTSPLGYSTAMAYDDFDRMNRATNRGGQDLVPTYAGFATEALVTGVDLEEGGQPLATLATQTFDGLGRITQRTIGGRATDYQFQSGYSRPNQVDLADGNSLRLSYVAELGQRPASVTGSAADDVADSYEYEAATGRLLETASKAFENTFQYSKTGRPKTGTESWLEAGKNLNTTFEHSLRGRLVSLSDADKTLSVTYDSYGRPTTTTCNGITSTSRYDGHGRIDQVVTQVGSGPKQTATVTYDDFSRETKRVFEVFDGGVQVKDTLELDYDVENRVTERRRLRGTSLVLTEKFTYDAKSRLTTYETTGSPSFEPVDALGLPVAKKEMSYDALDTILQITTSYKDGTTDVVGYEYGNSDPMQVSAVTHTHPLYPPRVELSYDAVGNLEVRSANGGDIQYSFNSAGRLARIDSDAGNFEYRYDALGRLVSTGADGASPELRHYLGRCAIAETEAGNTRAYARHQGLLVAEEGASGSGTRLLMADHLNSVVGSYESSTQSTESCTYLPFGENGATMSSNHRFAGNLPDRHSGLYLLGNGTRAYHPESGLFLSADGWSPFDMGGINPYVYCQGNPINLIDPSGRMSTQADLGMNVFFFIFDAILLAIAAASLIAGPEATVALVGAIMAVSGSTLGVASDTLGIAGDSMAIHDENHGRRDRDETMYNLGLAGSSLALAGMATDAASMTPHFAKPQMQPASIGADPSGSALSASTKKLDFQTDDVVFHRSVGDDKASGDSGRGSGGAQTSASRMTSEAPVKRSTTQSLESGQTGQTRRQGLQNPAVPLLDFLGLPSLTEFGKHKLEGNRKTLAEGVGLLYGSVAFASGLSGLINTTWEVYNGEEDPSQDPDLYPYLCEKLPLPPEGQ